MKSLRHHSLSSLVHGLSRMVCLVIMVYGVIIFSRMLSYANGALMAGHPYVWADWSLHIPIAAVFAWKPLALWLSSLPVFAGARLNYPFVADMISGLLWRAGLSLPSAFFIPSAIAVCLLVAAVVRLGKQLTGSFVVATLALVIFFCSGGLGLWEMIAAGQVREALLNSALTQTQNQTGILFTNIFMGMLVPQRAFLLGIPVGCVLLLLVYRIFKGERVRSRTLIGAGILAGLLPIIHTHTFIVIVFMSAWALLCSRRYWKTWGIFALVAGIVSFLTYGLFIHSTVQSAHFFSLNIGWDAHTNLFGWLIFWVRNWGVFAIAAVIAPIALWKKHKPLALFSCGWWVLFVVANIVQFQPQSWDNSKLFAWGYLGLSFPVALMLTQFAKRRRVAGSITVAALVILMCGSGAVDLLHMLVPETHTFQLLSVDEQHAGVFVRQHTAPTAVFLTSTSVSNPIALMSGRSILLGYPGWVFSYGLSYMERESDVSAMYMGGEQAAALLTAYNVDYVLFSPQEAGMETNEAWYKVHYPHTEIAPNTTLYCVKLEGPSTCRKE